MHLPPSAALFELVLEQLTLNRFQNRHVLIPDPDAAVHESAPHAVRGRRRGHDVPPLLSSVSV